MAIKKTMVALTTFLATSAVQALTVAELTADPKYLKLVEAGKGGFSGENNFVEVDGKKVGRVCAMTGAVFAHDNTDKAQSFFYKNGSYMIGAEVIKANAHKAWTMDKEDRLEALVNTMVAQEITPQDWKEQTDTINAEEFDFAIDEDVKAELIADFDGYDSKETFEEAFVDGAVAPFSDYEETIKALRALAPKREKEEAPEEVA